MRVPPLPLPLPVLLWFLMTPSPPGALLQSSLSARSEPPVGSGRRDCCPLSPLPPVWRSGPDVFVRSLSRVRRRHDRSIALHETDVGGCPPADTGVSSVASGPATTLRCRPQRLSEKLVSYGAKLTPIAADGRRPAREVTSTAGADSLNAVSEAARRTDARAGARRIGFGSRGTHRSLSSYRSVGSPSERIPARRAAPND